MIRSMTGYARVSQSSDIGELCWELRSVNHRYLDLSFRLPDEVRPAEADLRRSAARQLKRGKVDCGFFVRREGPGRDGTLNKSALATLKDQLHAVRAVVPGIGQPDALDVLRWPGVLEEPQADADTLIEQALCLFDEALESMNRMREREGERLAALIRERVDAIGTLADDVRRRRPDVVAAISERLRERIDRLDADVDPGRLEAEIVLIAQKLDVDEEVDRLHSHLTEIAAVLGRNEPVGRRLDFLMQELNREANTLASKSADAETTRAAVDMKVLIEQMREQIQNIE